MVSLTFFLCRPTPDAERSSFPPLSAGLAVLYKVYRKSVVDGEFKILIAKLEKCE